MGYNSSVHDYMLYRAAFTKTADGMLSFTGSSIDANGSPNIPLFKDMPDWKHIIMELNITDIDPAVLTTGVAFKAVTGVDPTADLTTSSTAAVKGDGSTAFASANITAAGKALISMSREGASSAVSNIASVLGVWADLTSATNVVGEAIILVTR